MHFMESLDSIAQLPPSRWQALDPQRDPFLSHAYLGALEQQGCVGEAQGWQPRHLIQTRGDRLEALMPLYLKQHSYGEFVFDWSWADAAQRAGIPYYPKLVTAIPFTPVTGPRLLQSSDASTLPLLQAVATQAAETQASSWHLLFPDRPTCERLQAFPDSLPLLERRACHFVWFNRDYRDFDHFLQQFSSRKRKNLRKERQKMAQQGVEIRRIAGTEIGEADLEAFDRFYRMTYHRRGQAPYLSPGFFRQLLATQPDRLLLVSARRQGQPVGSALFIQSDHALYGRWWGGLPQIDALHFELCYYQGIEYAIEQKLQRFDPGIQGEHKLLRGFEPVQTRSLHWLREPALRAAVDQWLQRERRYIDHYQREARQHLPFKQPR